ncbi:glycoside hydrolase [Plectosphaerella plurivora]|uniref:Glycoside hydrolase n=1 Tax=Plectosphaerella plurivora TaxID=936078 RepID=A0A9P8VGJ3_9PEZI|nr:glycoside hydrolase [Plectosphaerella plurivora]
MVTNTSKGLSHPHLRRDEVNGTKLIVNGEPFIILGGELHNSNFSSSSYMAEVWPRVAAQGFNTLLGGVSWAHVEPVEGQFDFTELDKVILGAREHGIHLVLLWFGTWKNAVSTYVPPWVKKDSKRFPRVRSVNADGKRAILDIVSPLSTECAEADARAFGKLLAHIRDFDGDHSTVLMVQVENETGILGDSRDRSALAEAAWEEPVPEALLAHLADNPNQAFVKRFPSIHKSGKHSWEDVFGKGPAADEMFMAKVAAAGKIEYPLPLYVNAWLTVDGPESLDVSTPAFVATSAEVAGGSKPGQYPSGGPCVHVLDEYETTCKEYLYKDEPLFIPEQRRDPEGARRMWLAYGTYGAIGVSPFAVEIDPVAVGREFKVLNRVKDVVAKAGPADRFGFFFDELRDPPLAEKPWVTVFGDLEVTIHRASVFGKPGPGGGLVVRLAENKFLLAGFGFDVRFRSLKKGAGFTGILSSRELEPAEDGTLRTGRIWNGDQIKGGEAMVMPNEEPDYGEFPIPASVPARTGLAEVEVYVLEEEP